MVTQKESKLSRQIMAALREQGVFCFKVHGTEFMMSGLPDVIACAEGSFVGLETKRPGQRENTTPRQKFVHSKIRQAGGVVEVVTSVDEALEVIQWLLMEAGE